MTSEHENRQPLGDDADFAARAAAPLRAAETLDATFESRLATAIRRDLQLRGGGASSSQGWRQWWLRQRTVSISPLVGFAIAAGSNSAVRAASRRSRSPIIPALRSSIDFLTSASRAVRRLSMSARTSASRAPRPSTEVLRSRARRCNLSIRSSSEPRTISSPPAHAVLGASPFRFGRDDTNTRSSSTARGGSPILSHQDSTTISGRRAP